MGLIQNNREIVRITIYWKDTGAVSMWNSGGKNNGKHGQEGNLAQCRDVCRNKRWDGKTFLKLKHIFLCLALISSTRRVEQHIDEDCASTTSSPIMEHRCPCSHGMWNRDSRETILAERAYDLFTASSFTWWLGGCRHFEPSAKERCEQIPNVTKFMNLAAKNELVKFFFFFF